MSVIFSIKIWFYYIPSFCGSWEFFNNRAWIKIALGIWRYFDTKFLNIFEFFEKLIPRTRFRVKRFYFRTRHYLLMNNYLKCIFSVKGIRLIRRFTFHYIKAFLSFDTIRILYLCLYLDYMDYKFKIYSDIQLWKELLQYIFEFFSSIRASILPFLNVFSNRIISTIKSFN